MRDRLDQALIAQDLNGPPCGIAGHSEQIHEVLLARQWILAWPEFACLNARAKPYRDLAMWRYSTSPVDLGQVHDQKGS
jgi:hypothetical protein